MVVEYFINDRVQLKSIASEVNNADIMTKLLGKTLFSSFLPEIDMCLSGKHTP